jgi:hypothetical protein
MPRIAACPAGGWEELMVREAPGVRYSAWRRPAACGGGLSEWRARTVYLGATAADVAAFQLDSSRRCEWDEGVDAYSPMDGVPAEDALADAPALEFWRMRYPAPFCPRDYVLARRVWHQPYSPAAFGDAPNGEAPGGDTVVYSVTKAPTGPLPAELEEALPPGRTHRVRVYHAGLRVRPVPGGAELETIYVEDAGIKPSVVEWTVKRSLWGFVEKQAAAMRAYVPAGGVGGGRTAGVQVGVRRQRPRQGHFGIRAALKAAGGAAKTYVAAVGRAAVAACAASGGDGTPRRVRSFSAPPAAAGANDANMPLSPPGTPRRRRVSSFNANAAVVAAAAAAAPQQAPATPQGRSRGGFDPIVALMAPLRVRARVGASIRRRAAAAFAAGASHVAAERARREARDNARFGPFVPVGDPPRRRRGELRGKVLMVAAAVALRVLRRAPIADGQR